MPQMEFLNNVERWGVQEVRLCGPQDGNPFVEQWIRGEFTGGGETVRAEGFYDGDGRYVVRFMPSFEGKYAFCVTASFLDGPVAGSFTVSPAASGNHGPVRVHNTWHFAYEDGTPYYSIGTTCYVWALQDDARVKQTLDTLRHSAFNKIRFCLLPKHYDYNLGEPRSYPYEGTPMDSSVLTSENFNDYTGKTEGNHWDFARFNPEHFRHLEKCVLALQEMGIEADLIVMHPYDRWGFSCMTREQDDLYWKYVLARFSAYRNVWWSLANEYDIMRAKTMADWEHYAALICELDPYRHLRSIHQCIHLYDHSRPWITHCSIQRVDLYKTAEVTDELRERYRKPVVLDEIAYEGNIQHGWGNIIGEEMLRRFWEAACRGGYPGHGETYLCPENVLWWSHGGVLRGESHKRFGLLRRILSQTPGVGLRPYPLSWDCTCAVPQEDGHGLYFLIYFSFMRPSFREFHFDDETPLRVEVIDTWEGTVRDAGVHCGKFRIELPGKPYMALRIRQEGSVAK